jgi:hypothetical protein
MAFLEQGTTLINDSGALALTSLTLTSTDRINVGVTDKLPVASFQGVTSGFVTGGYIGPKTAVIDKFSFATEGTSTNVGSIYLARYNLASQSSATYGYNTGGINPSDSQNTTTIDKYPFAISSGTGTLVGALSTGRQGLAGISSIPYGYGYSSGGSTGTVVDRFPFSSDTNATNILSISQARYTVAGISSSTYGYTAGGLSQDNSTYYTTIDKFPFASNTTATSVGALSKGTRYAAGQSSSTNGYHSGGNSSGTYVSKIEKFPFASDTNATGTGSLTIARNGAAGVSSTDYGYTAGGLTTLSSPYNYSSTIDRFGFAADTDAVAVGALSSVKYGQAGQQV